MLLFVDTSDFKKMHLVLVDGHKIHQLQPAVARDEARLFLAYLDRLIGKHKKDIDRIFVVSGPGSFTGIRIGVAGCLALGLAWAVPVYAIKGTEVPKKLGDLPRSKAKKISDRLELDYGAEPNITKPKKSN